MQCATVECEVEYVEYVEYVDNVQDAFPVIFTNRGRFCS